MLGARAGSGRNTDYYLELGPWGPRAIAEEVDVGKDYYARGSTQKTVCVTLHRGALGVRWFEVGDCQRD